MTARELVLAAINHQQPDRVPIGLRFAPEVERNLMEHLGVGKQELYEFIGEDLVTIRPKFPSRVTDLRYADPTIEVTDDGELLDIWRVPFRHIENELQSYVELAGNPPLINLQKIEELRNFPWPTANAWDYSNIEPGLETHKEKATWGHSRGFFEIAHFMRGMDNFFVDLAANPNFACSLMDYIADYLLQKSKRILELSNGRFVIFEYNDDVATQQSLMISPDMWRKYIKPRMKKFCDLFHGYGAKVRYHCCGSCYEIIPDLIEMGVDVLNPIQPLAVNMDPFKLKKDFGNDICLHGGVDTQQLLPNASANEIYNHVKNLIDVVGKGGGFILGTGHRIQADTPIENILALIRAANDDIL